MRLDDGQHDMRAVHAAISKMQFPRLLSATVLTAWLPRSLSLITYRLFGFLDVLLIRCGDADTGRTAYTGNTVQRHARDRNYTHPHPFPPSVTSIPIHAVPA